MASQAVLQILETLIAPGKRSRLSPVVKSAQLAVLFGQFPNTVRRSGPIHDILRQNSQRIAEIASAWVYFVEGKRDGSYHSQAKILTPDEIQPEFAIAPWLKQEDRL